MDRDRSLAARRGDVHGYSWLGLWSRLYQFLSGASGDFASGLTQYYNAQEQSDEQERDSYKENIPAWRANWSSITAMHYTECPLYSPLVSTKDSLSPERNSGADNKPIIRGGSWPSWARWRPDNRS